MSKMKNGCVTELTSEMHEKYDVHNLPYQNLNPTHPDSVWNGNQKSS